MDKSCASFRLYSTYYYYQLREKASFVTSALPVYTSRLYLFPVLAQQRGCLLFPRGLPVPDRLR
jgi:hypothetical protein